MIKGANLIKNLTKFLIHIDSIKDTLPMTILLLKPYREEALNKFLNFIKTNTKEVENENGKKSFLVKVSDTKLFETLERNTSISDLAGKIIPESLFVSLVSQYDAFLTRLLRCIFEIRPEILNVSDRNLSFSQLIEMRTIEDAREHIIEKEIETVLRKSHSEQFDYLEKICSLKLRENLPVWQIFIELTERRNLFVHCDGIISSQYVNNCNSHKCCIENSEINIRASISLEYFIVAYKALFEISVKLTHTIWRKLIPDELENADNNLNDICFNLICSKMFDLADILLRFACEQKKHFDDACKNTFIINSALSKYLQSKQEDTNKILSTKDWSACNSKFKLAIAILHNNFDDVYWIMRNIGTNGEITKSHYKEWPLFFNIRKEKGFKDTFKEIFNEDYSVLETPMRPLEELVSKEIINKQKTKNKAIKKMNPQDESHKIN